MNTCPAKTQALLQTSSITGHRGLIITANGSWSADITDSHGYSVWMWPTVQHTATKTPATLITADKRLCTHDYPLSHRTGRLTVCTRVCVCVCVCVCLCLFVCTAVKMLVMSLWLHMFSSAARNRIVRGAADLKSAAAAESAVAVKGEIFLHSSVRWARDPCADLLEQKKGLEGN